VLLSIWTVAVVFGILSIFTRKHVSLELLILKRFLSNAMQGHRQKNFQGGWAQRKKQDRKIAPLILPLLYQYHV